MEITHGARTKRRRRRRLRMRLAAGAVLAALIAAGTYVVVAKTIGKDGAPQAPPATSAEGAQTTYLVVTTSAEDLSGQADTLTLLALDQRSRVSLVLFLPVGAQTEVPGRGFDSLGRSLSFGGVPLTKLTVENVLGIHIDHTLSFGDEVIGKLVDGAGGLDVTLPSPLFTPDAQGRLVPVFQAGPQHLNGAQARLFLAFQGLDETELSRLVRVQQVWDGLFAGYRGKPDGFSLALDGLASQVSTDVTPKRAGSFLDTLAAAGTEGRVETTLPVSPIGAGGAEQTLKVDEAGIETIVAQYLAESRSGGQGTRARIELLNGNGTPEIGARVSQILVPAGFNLVLDRNANRFDYAITQILVYSSDEESMAIARRIRELLGVGEIQVSRRGQSVVDVTIVVGRDFLTVPRPTTGGQSPGSSG